MTMFRGYWGLLLCSAKKYLWVFLFGWMGNDICMHNTCHLRLTKIELQYLYNTQWDWIKWWMGDRTSFCYKNWVCREANFRVIEYVECQKVWHMLLLKNKMGNIVQIHKIGVKYMQYYIITIPIAIKLRTRRLHNSLFFTYLN